MDDEIERSMSASITAFEANDRPQRKPTHVKLKDNADFSMTVKNPKSAASNAVPQFNMGIDENHYAPKTVKPVQKDKLRMSYKSRIMFEERDSELGRNAIGDGGVSGLSGLGLQGGEVSRGMRK